MPLSLNQHRPIQAICIVVVAMLALLAARAGAAGPEDGQPAPVPAASEQEAARKLLKEVFKQDYAKGGAAAQQALATQLAQRSADEGAGSAARFVMLQEAVSLHVAAGSYASAAEAIGALEKGFAVDAKAMRGKALVEAAPRALTRPDAEGVAEAALAMAEQAVAAGDYEAAAGDLARIAEQASPRVGDKALVTRIRDRVRAFRATRDESRLAADAVKVLKTKPDDPQANLAVGRFLCFHLGQWDKGLPALINSGNAGLAALAKRDLAGASGVDARLEVGDGWRALGAAQPPGLREAYDRRAEHWYGLALTDATGLMRTKVLKKMRDLPGGVSFERLAGAIEKAKKGGNDRPKEPGLLVGFNYSFSNWGNHRIIKRFQPIWLTERGQVTGHTAGLAGGSELKGTWPTKVVARPGYAVGSIVIDKTDRHNGFKVVFMKMRGVVLDPGDAYESEWIGDHVDKTTTTLGRSGSPIIGLQLWAGHDLDGIELYQLE